MPVFINREMKKISFKNDVLPLKNKLFRLALRITLNREEAEDIVQDTLIKIWTQKDEWENINSLESFSLTICRNMALDRMEKKENQNIALDEDIHDSADISYSPDEELIRSERYSIVNKLVGELPEKQRSVLQLRDVEGKNYKEIADIMQISEADVKVTLFRARQKIKEQFNKFDNYGL